MSTQSNSPEPPLTALASGPEGQGANEILPVSLLYVPFSLIILYV